jgi:hypothetical protein
MSCTAVRPSSQVLLFNKLRFRSISEGYWCFMPRALTLFHSRESWSCMARVFIFCVDAFPRDRAVVLPDGSPITTVPPPSYSTLTCCCRTRPWLAHQADGVVAVNVHPVEHHEREKMADVEGGGGRVYTNIGTYGLFCEQPVERFSSTEASQHRPRSDEMTTTCTHPATSFTKPRSSRTLNMLCSAPAFILPARSSHVARRAFVFSFLAAHAFTSGAKVCCLRMHC